MDSKDNQKNKFKKIYPLRSKSKKEINSENKEYIPYIYIYICIVIYHI